MKVFVRVYLNWCEHCPGNYISGYPLTYRFVGVSVHKTLEEAERGPRWPEHRSTDYCVEEIDID